MANSCYFLMKIAGKEENVQTFIRMLQHTGEYARQNGLGRISSFEIDEDTIERSPDNGQYYSVEGQGDCDWSLKTALQDYKSRDLLKEVKRLGLFVEAYSSEPGCEFQEHLLIDRGKLLVSDCIDYEEYFVEDMDESQIQKLLQDKGITREELMSSVNSNGDYCVGGFHNFGDFHDPFPYLMSMQLQYTDPWGEVYTVYPYINKYDENDNLYMGLAYFDMDTRAVLAFADVTINAGRLPYLHGAIAPFYTEKEIKDFLTQNNFGEYTGEQVQCDFATYPVFRFNEDKLREISSQDYAIYAKAHGRVPKQEKSLLDQQIQNAESKADQDPKLPPPTPPEQGR